MKQSTTLLYWLPKIPLLSLIGIFLLPLILIEINYHVGLFFIALYISYWSVKVFESYFYVLRSYFRLLKFEKKDFRQHPIILKEGKKLKHIVIVPIYTEPYDVIEENITSLLATEYTYKKNITILLATEERAVEAAKNAERIIQTYGNGKISIYNILHPANLPNEGKVK